MHEHKVTVTATVKNHDSNQYSFTLNKEDASVSISIKPSKNGANEKVYIELEVKTQMTDGEKTDTRNYNFITS
jgi:hypothetical protein